MTTLEVTVLIGAGAFVAGLLGALTGLGGGVVIVPLLTLVFGIDFRYAVGASLVSVIATSSGAAASRSASVTNTTTRARSRGLSRMEGGNSGNVVHPQRRGSHR